jgi:VWFA-related protein
MMPGGRSFVTLTSCLAAAALTVLGAQDPPASAPPQFRAGVDVFEFEVSVLDRNRQPVRGLTGANFSVLENGKPQPIVGFAEVEFPESDGPLPSMSAEVAPDVTGRRYADRRLWVLVMDDWGMPEGIANFQMVSEAKAIGKYIVDQLGPLDFGAVILTRDTRYFPDFTNDRWKLTGAINNLKPPENAERAYLQLATHGHIGGPVALGDVADYLAKLPQHRKAIIYVSIGQGMRPGGTVFDRTVDAMKIAKDAGIPIYAIDPSGLSMRGMAGLDELKTIAENTGGVAVVGSNDFRPGVQQIFHENQSYYLLGYQQTGPADGKFRKIEVRVNRPGLVAYARAGRNAPGAPDMVKGAPAPVDEAVDAAVEVLTRGSERRASTYAVLRPAALQVVAEIGAIEAATPTWSHGADVEVRVTRGGGELVTIARGRIAPTDRGALLDIPLKDASGQAVDESRGPFHISARIASGSDSLEDGVDATSGGALLSAPLVFRGGSGPRAPLRPVAEFIFSRTERMHLDFPELKPLTERRARLLRRNGEALTVMPETAERAVDGQPAVLTADFTLSFLAPGDYVLEVFVRAGQEAERKLVAFRVR